MTLPIVPLHDDNLARVLDVQVTDPQNRWCGSYSDSYGLYHCHSAAHVLRDGAAALFHPQSRFYMDELLYERMRLANEFLIRSQSADGNISLITTNFNSPPDTGFVVHEVATAAKLAQIYEHHELLSMTETFLRRAGQGMTKGGIHTPNHRWVVCAALAQIHDLFPDDRYTRRIEQWLAEGIDIDDEGQFIERSTTVYNGITDRALVVMAHRLDRPELLEPVRKNLDAMAYLIHPNHEVVTEISRRQDLNASGTMAGYWFALRYMALRDQNGLYAGMLQPLEPAQMRLATLMEYPELQQALPEPLPLPQNYERHYPLSDITRVRRGKTSVTIMRTGNSRWISVHHGQAVINAIRFASAFFGKGQFVPESCAEREDGFHFRQELEGNYYQPIADSAVLPARRDTWTSLRNTRRRTETNRMVYETAIAEHAEGFDVSLNAYGTDGVPLSVEINLRDNGELAGVEPAPNADAAYLLRQETAEYRVDSDTICFGPGRCEHTYTQVRGAHAKLPGRSVYLTGFTPFSHTLRFRLQQHRS